MKREIKFRVWNGQQMDYNIMAGFLGAFYVKGLDERDSASMSQFNTVYHEGTPVMQFSGLKDRNGKEIYEGDVVKVYGQFEIPFDDKKDFEIITYEHVGTVIFENGCFVFKNHLSKEKLLELRTIFEDSALDTDITSSIDSFIGVEILGNIYENESLLK